MCEITTLNRFKKLAFERELLKLLSKCGVKRSEVEEIPKEFADRKPEEGVEYYYYVGPNDDKTRAFCKLMLKLDKVFSIDEISYISEELNYPVLEYKGSYNCRHNWVRFRGKRIFTPKPTVREIRKLINSGIEA